MGGEFMQFSCSHDVECQMKDFFSFIFYTFHLNVKKAFTIRSSTGIGIL